MGGRRGTGAQGQWGSEPDASMGIRGHQGDHELAEIPQMAPHNCQHW